MSKKNEVAAMSELEELEEKKVEKSIEAKTVIEENPIKATSTKKVKKMSLTKFLEAHPQTTYMTALLKKDYAMSLMLEAEWLELVEQIRTKKITD